MYKNVLRLVKLSSEELFKRLFYFYPPRIGLWSFFHYSIRWYIFTRVRHILFVNRAILFLSGTLQPQLMNSKISELVLIYNKMYQKLAQTFILVTNVLPNTVVSLDYNKKTAFYSDNGILALGYTLIFSFITFGKTFIFFSFLTDIDLFYVKPFICKQY